MKQFVIFVASSNELWQDRVVLGDMTREFDDEYESKGVRVKLTKWEDLPSYYRIERSQDCYNRKVVEADLVVVLLDSKLGEYTKEEYELALSMGKPVLVCVKCSDGCVNSKLLTDKNIDLTKIDGGYIKYENIAEIKGNIAPYIEAVRCEGSSVSQAQRSRSKSICVAISDANCGERYNDAIVIRDTIRSLNDMAESFGLRIRVVKQQCKDKDIHLCLIDGQRSEIDSDVKSELDDSIEQYKSTQKPDINIFMRPYTKGLCDYVEKQYTHFAKSYDNVETLKLFIVSDLQHQYFAKLSVPIFANTDILYLNNEPFINLTNIDFIRRDGRVAELMDKITKTIEEIDKIDASEASSKVNELESTLSYHHTELSTMIGHIYNIFKNIVGCQDSANREVIQELYTLLMEGRYDDVERKLNEVLNSEMDVLKAYDKAHLEMREFFSFYDIYRDLVLMRTGGEEGFVRARELYEEEIEKCKTRFNMVEMVQLYVEYATFLKDRTNADCVDNFLLSIKLVDALVMMNAIDKREASLYYVNGYTSVAMYYWAVKHLDEATTYMDKALAHIDGTFVDVEYLVSVANTYDECALLCVERILVREAEGTESSAVIREELLDAIDHKYSRALHCFELIGDVELSMTAQNILGSINSNIGRAYWNIYCTEDGHCQRWADLSIEYLNRAIKIRESISGLPSINEPKLVFPINNFGELYTSIWRNTHDADDLNKAMEYYTRAKRLLERHILFNVQTLGPRTIGIDGRIARTYGYLGDGEMSMKLLREARQKLNIYAEKMPDKYTYRLDELEQIEQEMASLFQ